MKEKPEYKFNYLVIKALEYVSCLGLKDDKCNAVFIRCYHKNGSFHKDCSEFDIELGNFDLKDEFAVKLLLNPLKLGYDPEKLFLLEVAEVEKEFESCIYPITLCYFGDPVID